MTAIGTICRWSWHPGGCRKLRTGGGWPSSCIRSVRVARGVLATWRDLADLGVWAADEFGADFVLVNPLHAAALVTPMENSPYLPATRRFEAPDLHRPERIEEYAYTCRGRRSARSRPRGRSATAQHRRPAGPRRSVDGQAHGAGAGFDVPRSPSRKVCSQPSSPKRGRICRSSRSGARWPSSSDTPVGQWPEQAKTVEPDPHRIEFYAWLQWGSSTSNSSTPSGNCCRRA